MRNLFRRTKSLSEDPKDSLRANAEYVDSSPKEPSQEALPSAAFEPITINAEPDTESEHQPVPTRGLARAMRALPTLKLPKFPSNRRIVTLSTEKDVFRVVVFKGRKVVAWGSADPSSQSGPLGNPPDDDSLENQEEITKSPLESLLTELEIGCATHVWSLLDKVGIRRCRTVMDLSLYTTLTRQLQIPKVKSRYLEPVVLSEVLETLPFSKEEVEIAWQIQDGNEGNSVFAVAMPKQRLNNQVMAVKEAGLAPAAAYSKSAALASVSGVLNGVVIHLEISEAALVLVQNGNPKAVHQVEFGEEESNPEMLASNIARAYGQVASYYLPEDPKQQNLELPVIFTGKVGETNPVAQLLIDKIQRRILTIDPALSYPQDFPAEEYAINLGLFLTDQDGGTQGNKGSSELPSLNLLPRRHRPSPIPVFQTSVFVILLLLAVHPFNVMGKVAARIAEKEAISSELQKLRVQEQQFTVVLASHQENRTVMDTVSLQADALEAQVETLEDDINALLEQVSSITRLALAQNITLSGVTPQGDDFVFAASASSHAKALEYVQTLKDNPLFEDARVLQIDGMGGANPNDDGLGVVNFQVNVTKSQPDAGESEPD